MSGGLMVNAHQNEDRIDNTLTTEDVLMALIKPKLDKIVKDQYGKEMIVNPMKVNNVAIITKPGSTKGKDEFEGWYELDMSMMVGEPDKNPSWDHISLKVDAPNIGGTAPHVISDKIEGIEVELVKYYKEK